MQQHSKRKKKLAALKTRKPILGHAPTLQTEKELQTCGNPKTYMRQHKPKKKHTCLQIRKHNQQNTKQENIKQQKRKRNLILTSLKQLFLFSGESDIQIIAESWFLISDIENIVF